jgi:hypothetical protein
MGTLKSAINLPFELGIYIAGGKGNTPGKRPMSCCGSVCCIVLK